MSEYTAWTSANLRTTGGDHTDWADLNNAEIDDAAVARAVALGGSWSSSPAHLTDVIAVSGRSTLDPLIPENATIDQVELRFHFILPQNLNTIAQIRIYKSGDYQNPTYDDWIGTIWPTAGNTLVEHSEAVSNAEGRAIAQGGDILPMFGYHELEDPVTDDWRLEWRYAEFRLRFTRAPNVPRTAYMSLF